MHSLESPSVRLEIDGPAIRIIDREGRCTWEAIVATTAPPESDGRSLTLSTPDARWRWKTKTSV